MNIFIKFIFVIYPKITTWNFIIYTIFVFMATNYRFHGYELSFSWLRIIVSNFYPNQSVIYSILFSISIRTNTSSSLYLYIPLYTSIYLYIPLYTSIYLYIPLYTSIYLYIHKYVIFILLYSSKF
jgi:hypothetical protein